MSSGSGSSGSSSNTNDPYRSKTTKRNNDGTGTTWNTRGVSGKTDDGRLYGGTSTHTTQWDGNTNTRRSYDVNPSPSGGWNIQDDHTTNQNASKGSDKRHK